MRKRAFIQKCLTISIKGKNMFHSQKKSFVVYGLKVKDINISQELVNSQEYKELSENSIVTDLIYFKEKEDSFFGFILCSLSDSNSVEIPERDISMLANLCISLKKVNIDFKYLSLKTYLIDFEYMES